MVREKASRPFGRKMFSISSNWISKKISKISMRPSGIVVLYVLRENIFPDPERPPYFQMRYFVREPGSIPGSALCF